MHKFWSLILFSIFFANLTFAQTAKVYPKTNIKKGVLKNGLTYYIYNNPTSKGKVSFYLIQDVGSILEEDSQNGLAHFLEHMAFNGTKHFPGNTMVDKLESKGLRYSINAYTGIDQTVYYLKDIPANDQALCDECLLILYDWCNNITLEDAKIEAERPVIIEERRTRSNLGFRLNALYAPVLYNNSKYAYRDIIGNPEIIKNFHKDELINFYNTWYRPDLQAVVVIGDINEVEVESKVKGLFSRLEKAENPKERYHVTIPENKGILFAEARDKEMKVSSVRITYRHDFVNNMQKTYKGLLINQMITKKVHKLLKDTKEDKIFTGLSMGFGMLVHGYGNYDINVSANPDKMKEALTKALGLQKYMLQTGFTEEEFENVKAGMEKVLKQNKKARGIAYNDSHIENIKKNFVSKVDILDPDTQIKEFNKFLKENTLEDINAEFRAWYSGPNKAIIVSGKEDDELLSKQEVLDIEANCEPLEVLIEEGDDKEEVKDLEKKLALEDLKGSAVVQTEKIKELSAEKWILENGATVIYKECSLVKDAVNLFAMSAGGISILNGDDINNAMTFNSFTRVFGVEGLTSEQMKDLAKVSSVRGNLKLTQEEEQITLGAKYGDVESMFQLLYNQFENPAFYEDVFEEEYAKLKEATKKIIITHQKQMNDSIGIWQYGEEKHQMIDTNWVNRISLEGLEKVYRGRFKDASDFTFFIVGGIGKGKAKSLTEKYIGSIPSVNRKETVRILENKLPAGRIKKALLFDEIPGNKAGVTLKIFSKQDFTLDNKLMLAMLKSYLALELQKEIRDKERGTYGVSVDTKLKSYTSHNCEIAVAFECEPARVEELDDILYREILRIGKEGINPTNLELLKKAYEEKAVEVPLNRKNNTYYLNTLVNLLKSGTNSDDIPAYKEKIELIDKESIDKLLSDIIEHGIFLDVIYKQK